jgi:hypothetical protein
VAPAAPAPRVAKAAVSNPNPPSASPAASAADDDSTAEGHGPALQRQPSPAAPSPWSGGSQHGDPVDGQPVLPVAISEYDRTAIGGRPTLRDPRRPGREFRLGKGSHLVESSFWIRRSCRRLILPARIITKRQKGPNRNSKESASGRR